MEKPLPPPPPKKKFFFCQFGIFFFAELGKNIFSGIGNGAKNSAPKSGDQEPCKNPQHSDLQLHNLTLQMLDIQSNV